MSQAHTIKVLLIEDDEDDFIITRELLADIKGHTYVLHWVKSYDAGLRALVQNEHDVCLVDYILGEHNGVELLLAAKNSECQVPIILLTGMGKTEVDLAAMNAGAADYLVKNSLESNQLERTIRYAIERKHASAQAAFEQARLAAFGAQVGEDLARRAPLLDILNSCARAMVRYLNSDLAQIWLFNAQHNQLEPQAQAGRLTEATGAMAEFPAYPFDLEELARGKPVFHRALAGNPQFPHQDWASRKKLVSFAAYPLLLEDRLVGCMSLYAHAPMAEGVLQEIGSVASGVALCIQRKQAEAALDASEHRYISVVENIKEVIFQMNESGHWVFLNPAWEAVSGFTVKETGGTFFLDYFHHDDRERNRYIFLQLLERKINYCRHETRLLTKQGKVRWVELYLQLTFDRDGTVLGLSGSLNDITERKLAEAEAQKLAAFPRFNPNSVLEFNAAGTLTYANDAAVELAKSLGKQNVLEILPADVVALVGDCLAHGIKKIGQKTCLEGRTLTWSFFPIAASRVVHCYGSDITEMLNLEAQFRHAQKLESVGQLAAGVAHDFNNILTVVQGYADCLLMEAKNDSAAIGPLKQISDAARRATTLTRQLLMFSRKQVALPRTLNLNSVLQNFAALQSRLLGEAVVFETHYAPDLPLIEADTGMIEQIAMNLAVNARDAMPKGGQLTITTSARDVDENHAHQKPDARPGWHVCMAFRDTGCGMDEKVLSRIFEPFFSTKEVGSGTGLGLATVYGIVKQHHGWIEVTSQVGVGTTFEIYFPAVAAKVEAAAGEPSASPAPTAIRGGEETILVVEDEPNLREMVCTILHQYQYRILEAGSGVEALNVWDEHDGQIDLVLTDMVMPEGLTGGQLGELLRQRKPEIKIICTSGYSSEIMGNDFSAKQMFFLAKPYRSLDLVKIVRECLDTPVNVPPAVEVELATA